MSRIVNPSDVQTTVTLLDCIASSNSNKMLLQHTKYLLSSLSLEVKRLNKAIKEEAEYCEKYEKECLERGEVERSLRHMERKERLLSKIKLPF